VVATKHKASSLVIQSLRLLRHRHCRRTGAAGRTAAAAARIAAAAGRTAARTEELGG
jgi:hypothetical protein